jgi:hypothetical protein
MAIQSVEILTLTTFFKIQTTNNPVSSIEKCDASPECRVHLVKFGRQAKLRA